MKRADLQKLAKEAGIKVAVPLLHLLDRAGAHCPGMDACMCNASVDARLVPHPPAPRAQANAKSADLVSALLEMLGAGEPALVQVPATGDKSSKSGGAAGPSPRV